VKALQQHMRSSKIVKSKQKALLMLAPSWEFSQSHFGQLKIFNNLNI
jgi:hypothetical protein